MSRTFLGENKYVFQNLSGNAHLSSNNTYGILASQRTLGNVPNSTCYMSLAPAIVIFRPVCFKL